MSRIAPALLSPDAYSFAIEVATRFADLDPNGHINNVAMAAAFEDARFRFVLSLGGPQAAGGARMVIASVYVDYLAEAMYPLPLTMRVGVSRVGRTSWTMHQLAEQQGQVKAYCSSTLVATSEGRPTPLSEAWRTKLQEHIRVTE